MLYERFGDFAAVEIAIRLHESASKGCEVAVYVEYVGDAVVRQCHSG